MAKERGGLQELFVEELQDLFDAEKQLVKALPKMAKSATDEELANAFRQHLEVTKGQVQRLQRVFESMDMRARSKPCKGMKGLVEEGQEIIEEHEDSTLDSAITGAARKVEHYEMVGYESVRSMAQQLGLKEAAQLLQETLQEETQTDKQLAQISKRLLKEATSRRPEAEESQSGGGSRNSGKKASSSGKSSSRSSSSSSSSRSSGSSRSSNSSKRSSGGSKSSHTLTDREEIRQWAEDRGAQPSCVRGTGGKGDIGMLRLDFPGYSGEDSLEPIEWDEWFDKFDERGLALLVQEKTAGGQKSNFNKLVSREASGKPKTKTAR
jgi:ferritin-like metal-binding protein YciE